MITGINDWLLLIIIKEEGVYSGKSKQVDINVCDLNCNFQGIALRWFGDKTR